MLPLVLPMLCHILYVLSRFVCLALASLKQVQQSNTPNNQFEHVTFIPYTICEAKKAREALSRLPASARLFLDVFAGFHAPVTTAVAALGLEALRLGCRRSLSYTRDPTFELVLQICWSGIVGSALFAPPSILPEGSPALRTPEHLAPCARAYRPYILSSFQWPRKSHSCLCKCVREIGPQAKPASATAIGKLNLVEAPGKDPRLVLDSTVCQVNPNCSLRCVLFQAPPLSILPRLGALLLRITHSLLAQQPHRAWLYVDDLLAALIWSCGDLQLALLLVLFVCLKTPSPGRKQPRATPSSGVAGSSTSAQKPSALNQMVAQLGNLHQPPPQVLYSPVVLRPQQPARHAVQRSFTYVAALPLVTRPPAGLHISAFARVIEVGSYRSAENQTSHCPARRRESLGSEYQTPKPPK